MRAVFARTRQVHIIIHPNAHTYSRAHATTQRNNLCVSRSSKQQVGHVGFSYYFQRGPFWSPLHVYIGVVSSVISTDTFPLLYPVSEINRISNCLILPYQRENLIYETSSHEKPILRDYLLITETAQLTDKFKRGDLWWMRNTVYVQGRLGVCLGCILYFNAAKLETNKTPKKESQSGGLGYLFVFLSLKKGSLSNQALLHSFAFRTQGTKQFLLISILLLCLHQEAAAHSIAVETPIHQSFMIRHCLITDIEIFNCL